MRLKIDCASLLLPSHRFSLFYFVFDGNFPVQAPRGGLYLEGDLTEVFCVTSLGGLYLEGLIYGGAYFWNFKVYGENYKHFFFNSTGKTTSLPNV